MTQRIDIDLTPTPTQEPVYFEKLTPKQLKNGISENQLERLEFLFKDPHHFGLAHQMGIYPTFGRFFEATRMAMSESKFVDLTYRLLDEKYPHLEDVMEVLQRVFAKPRLDVPTLNEQDYESVAERTQHNIYNHIVEGGNPELLHPANIEALKGYLKELDTTDLGTVKDVNTMAEGLCATYAYGSNYARYKRVKREFQQSKEELSNLQSRLENLQPEPIVGRLEKETLAFLKDEFNHREPMIDYVVAAYNLLADNNQMSLMEDELDINYISTCHSPKKVNPTLRELAQRYQDSVSYGSEHCGVGLDLLRHLRHGDLSELRRHCLTDKMAWEFSSLRFDRKSVHEAKTAYKNSLELAGRKASDYKRGDFSFINDPLTQTCYKHAFDAIEKLQVWDFFDEEPPKDCGYMFWSHPTLSLLSKELTEDGHSGMSWGFTMRGMQRIRAMGWESWVEAELAPRQERLGVLARI
ncbi:MAG: hypothetical protein KDK78_05910 [Chlamydiia bacterium]|nr:hypothetical protein [Chlamydiia bacterium]